MLGKIFLVLLLLTGAVSSGAAQDRPKYGALVDAPGAAETYAFCIACHSEKIIVQQGLSRDGWDELLDWMAEEQGMADPPVGFRNKILDYLAANYNIDRPNFPATK